MDAELEPFVRIARVIEQRYGLSPLIQRERLLAYFGNRSALDQQHLENQLALALDSDSQWQQLIEAMLVHETYFYRHSDQLDVMSREVLPILRNRRNREGTQIQVWCAGCSTGEEAYTLAFLLRDAACQGKVIATDVSALALDEAQKALYRNRPGLNSFRTLPKHAWGHFDAHPHESECWSIAPGIRHMVDFKVHNLMTPLQSGKTFDLISCRNTLIYFSDDSLRQVESMIMASAQPGTIMLLGPAERLRYTSVFVPMTESHPQILHWPLPESQ